MPFGYCQRFVRYVIAIATIAFILIVPLTALQAGASGKHSVLPPTCRPAQLQASMSPVKGTYSSLVGFKATLWFQNIGASCTLGVDNVPVQGVRGKSHTPVGIGSLSGAVAYQPIVLANGERAGAPVSIGSISTPAFKQMERKVGSSCVPKYADGIEVVSNPSVRGDSWPSHYFALRERVPICTGNFFNVSAGVIEKLPTHS